MRFAILRKAEAPGRASALPGLAASHGVTLHEHLEFAPGAKPVRIRFSDDGPHRLPPVADGTPPELAGFCIVEAENQDAVIDWLKRAPVDAVPALLEIRETGCPGGLAGVDPSSGPSDQPRFLILLQADADTEADAHPAAARLAAMARRNDEAAASGMLLAADGLKSTASGARVRLSAGKPSVMDGPFAETKELVAGFWLIQAASMDVAIDWVCRYPYAQDRPEVHIWPVAP